MKINRNQIRSNDLTFINSWRDDASDLSDVILQLVTLEESIQVNDLCAISLFKKTSLNGMLTNYNLLSPYINEKVNVDKSFNINAEIPEKVTNAEFIVIQNKQLNNSIWDLIVRLKTENTVNNELGGTLCSSFGTIDQIYDHDYFKNDNLGYPDL